MYAKKFICLIINVLCKNHVFLTVQFFDTTVHFLYTLLLFLLHIPPHFLIHTVCFIPYNLMIFTFIWYKSNGCMVRKQRINKTKARLKSGKTHLKVISYRPLWTWRTVDARVYNDRYEHGERSVWDDFLNAFARFSQCFRPIFKLISDNNYLNSGLSLP